MFELVEIRGVLSGGLAVRGRWVSRAPVDDTLKFFAMLCGRARLTTDGIDRPTELEPGDVAILNGRSWSELQGGTADGAAGTATFLGERHRRLSSRPGGGGRRKANVAVGRSILVIVWHLLKNPEARYRDLGPDHYARHADAGRKIHSHTRQLEALGLDVTVPPPGVRLTILRR